MKKAQFTLHLMMLLLMAVKAPAYLVTFTHEGYGNGTIDGIPFPDSNFVITAFGDTIDRFMPIDDVWAIPHISAFISIASVGDFEFLTQTFTFVNNSQSLVGFTRSTADLFDGPTHELFSTWDMLEPIGPISGTGHLVQWDPAGGYSPVETTGGVLIFETNWETEATFRAIPEPATIILFGVAIPFMLRRRRIHV